MLSKLRMASWAVVATLALSGLALAQDRDEDRYRDQNRWGYQDRDGDRDRDRDGDRDRYRDRDDYRFRGGNVARDWGSRDGAEAAWSDQRVGKSFNPNPRGRYKHSDRGYERYFGDKREYQEQYAQSYRESYERAWQRGGWRR